MYRKITNMFSVILAVAVASPLLSQSIPREQQAEIAFEFQMGKFRESPLYGTLKDAIENSPALAQAPPEFDWEKIDSVLFAIALPESMEEAMALQNVDETGELSTELFARITFVDGAGADQLEGMIKEDSDTKTIEGKSYYSPKSESDGPKNILAHRVDETTMTFGTESYMTTGVGKHLFSSGLQAALDKMPNDGLRFAIDLNGAGNLIEEAVEMGKASADNPMLAGFLNLVLNANDIRISMDLADGDLLTLGVSCKDEENATKFQEGFDGILGMGKMIGAQGVEQLKQQNPDAGRVLGEILKSLNANRDGNDVVLAIPKPEGFDEAIQDLISAGGDF